MHTKIAVPHCLSAKALTMFWVVTRGRIEPTFRRRTTPALVAQKAVQVQNLHRFFKHVQNVAASRRLIPP
jgi:hypothetical protein